MRASKRGTPLKSGYFTDIGMSSVKTVEETGIDTLLIMRSTNDELFSVIDIDDLEPPKIGSISFFQFSASVQTSQVNCDEIAGDRQDNLRTGTAKAVARFMNFAQITCFILVILGFSRFWVFGVFW